MTLKDNQFCYLWEEGFNERLHLMILYSIILSCSDKLAFMNIRLSFLVKTKMKHQAKLSGAFFYIL